MRREVDRDLSRLIGLFERGEMIVTNVVDTDGHVERSYVYKVVKEQQIRGEREGNFGSSL